MENYIVINGKKTELTEEQLAALGIEIEIEKENPFEPKDDYYYINSMNEVIRDYCSIGCLTSELRYNVGNYCTNKELMKQRALHETLNRLLWRYSMQHDGDEMDWSDKWQDKYRICYNVAEDWYYVDENQFHKVEGAIYFISEEVAEDAIEKVVKPFIKQHPEFEW